MSVITTATNPRLLWPGLKAIWGNNYTEHDLEWKKLFAFETSDKAREEDQQVTQFGLVPVKSQGAAVTFDTEGQGYNKAYNHVTYAMGYIVSMEERDDNQYEDVAKRRTQGLAFSLRQTEEIVHANVFNRAFNSSYTGGDAKELCATDHPTRAGGTQQNELTTAADMSEASLEDLVVLVMGAENDRGLAISLLPNQLVVPRQNWFEANRILKSTLQNDSANNAINVLKATNAFPGGIVMNHYLTDQDAFFVTTNVPRGLMHFDRKAAEFSEDGEFDSENMKYKVVRRFSCGWTDWRGVFGSPGA